MTDATSGPLRDAYEAIQANQLPKARGILSVYVADKPNDPDAWWLYSYAAENPTEARKALENVLRLDPMYPGARDLLTEVNQSIGSEPVSAPAGLRQLGGASSSPQTPKSVVTDDFDDLDDLDDFEEDDDDDDSGFSRRRILFAIAGFALVILLIVVVFGVLPRSNTTPEATNVAQAATDTSIILPTITDSAIIEATTDTVIAVTPEPSAETIGTTPTIELVRAETETPADDLSETIVAPDVTPSSAALDGFYSALSGFAVTPDSVAVEETSLGQTLSATVCLQNQGELRNAIPSAISAMASASAQAPDEAQFMGVKFINCADNSLLRYVAVPVADARAFADGSLTEAQLRAVQSNITR